MKRVVFLGAPGAGKGTVAAKAAEILTIPHISTGDIFRKAIKEETPLGKEVKSILASGELVSDQLTSDLVKERLRDDDAQRGYLLDGFPRSVNQAELLKGYSEVEVVVLFTLEHEKIIARLSGRRSCPSCTAGYHTEYMPPQKEGVCDKCAAALVQRPDDRPEAIAKRLDVYEESTKPLIDYYDKAGKLFTIDASPSPDQVLTAFLEVIK